MNKYVSAIAYTFFANIINAVVMAFATFFLPNKMGVAEYGYIQLYLFYTNYTGFLHLGWADGIYLKYGGIFYDKIDKRVFSGQFWLYSIIELALGILVCVVGAMAVPGQKKAVVFAFTGLSICIYLPRTLLQYILQSTNRVKEYSAILIIDRLCYLVLILIVFCEEFLDFKIILAADIIAKTISLLLALYYCRDIIFVIPDSMCNTLREAKENIISGSRLMFANVTSMLIIGIVRLAIENKWDIETFGKISLTMSVSNLFMILINAVAMVMFPALRRSKQGNLPKIYIRIRTVLVIPLLGMLIFYYPMEQILSFWLPKYIDGLQYMAILFPICLFECKMSLLVSTYMKTLRKERWLMQVNVSTLILSIILTVVNVYILENLDLTVISIVILLGFRSVISELLISNELNITLYRNNAEEIILSAIFIGASWFIQGYMGVVVYLVCYLGYLMLHIEHIKSIVEEIKIYR